MFSESFFVGSESSLAEGDRLCHIALGQELACEIATHAIRVRMLGAERLLEDRQCALEKRPRPHKVALVLKQAGEEVKAQRRRAMLGAERLLEYR